MTFGRWLSDLGGRGVRVNVQRIMGWTAVAAVAVGATAAAPAAAQDQLPKTGLTAKFWATPNKAGTKRHPRGVRIEAVAKIESEPGYERPIVTGLDIKVGKGLVWNADDYVKCSKRVLDRKGPEGCPPESIVGRADLTAWADNVVTHPDVVLVNGGWKQTFAYTTLYQPALVQETIVVHRTKLSGKWSHLESIRVPKHLQVVAGVPIQVSAAEVNGGAKPYAREYVTSTSCPKGGWKYEVTTHFLFPTGATRKDVFAGSAPCRK
jgi:hypothetical protein